MEGNQPFICTDNNQECNNNINRNAMNASDRLLIEENLNIATMSDSQFSESLEALIDMSYPDDASPPPLSSQDIPECYEIDDNESVVKAKPVEVNDAYSTSLQQINASGNNLIQQSIPQQTTTTTTIPINNFFQQGNVVSCTQQPLMMPLTVGFDPNAFMVAAAQNFVPISTTSSAMHPPLTLQQSIEAFGRSMASNQQQQQHMYPVPSMTPFAAMTVPSSSPFISPMQASTSSIASLPSKRSNTNNLTCPISEDECDFRKRKADRNAREQQRAQQVTDQISHLRELIVRSGVELDKIDKFSTLIAVEKYIRNLESKSQELKNEHEKLLSTLQQTTENVNSQYVAVPPPSTSVAVSSGGEETSRAQDTSDQDEDSEGDVPFVKEVNYKWIFDCCPFASSIASIDGRFLDCNKEFEVLTGYSRAELLPLEHQNDISSSTNEKLPAKSTNEPSTLSTMKKTRNMSIFNILHRECIERVFCEMSKVLQRYNNDNDEENNSNTQVDPQNPSNDTICQEVDLCKRSNQKATIRITLVRSPKGLPRFFNCLLIPSEPR